MTYKSAMDRLSRTAAAIRAERAARAGEAAAEEETIAEEEPKKFV